MFFWIDRNICYFYSFEFHQHDQQLMVEIIKLHCHTYSKILARISRRIIDDTEPDCFKINPNWNTIDVCHARSGWQELPSRALHLYQEVVVKLE